MGSTFVFLKLILIFQKIDNLVI